MRNFETSGGTSSLSPVAVAGTQTCLTVVPPDTNFAAARWGGIGCYTPIWSPLVDIQIVKVTAHCSIIEVATCNGVISDWNAVEMKSGNVRIKGCSLGFVVDADTDTVSYLHFTFSGMAFRNPVSPSTDVRESI